MQDKKKNHKLSLEDTKLSKRWPSWGLFLGILMLFLIIPLISLVGESSRDLLRQSPLPSDNAWISGKLSPPHQIPELNQNCQACHVDAFEMVQDDTCLSCHADTNHHFDVDTLGDDLLDGSRCASCHREHDEPADLVRHDDRLCVNCHADLSESVQTELSDVDGFGDAQRGGDLDNPHPGIQVSMLRPQGTADATTWTIERTALSTVPLEKSNLVFPHDVHMAAEGIDSPEGTQVLSCNNCHVSDDAGKLMQPVTMENNCRSCHTLVFDPDEPEREVPHGDPDTVLLTLEEYYSRQYLLQSLGREPTPQEIREFALRRPGGNVQRRADQTLNLTSPWGKAMSVAEEIFTRTTCKTCHVTSIDDSGDHLSKWRVDPIRLTNRWMPKTEFDHFSHRTFDCSGCHAASNSADASDVLMPDLATCQSCHTGSRTHESKLPSNCISCHLFHLPDQEPWGLPDHSSEVTNNP